MTGGNPALPKSEKPNPKCSLLFKTTNNSSAIMADYIDRAQTLQTHELNRYTRRSFWQAGPTRTDNFGARMPSRLWRHLCPSTAHCISYDHRRRQSHCCASRCRCRWRGTVTTNNTDALLFFPSALQHLMTLHWCQW